MKASALVWVPAASFLVQLPGNAPEKAAGNGKRPQDTAGLPSPMWQSQDPGTAPKLPTE